MSHYTIKTEYRIVPRMGIIPVEVVIGRAAGPIAQPDTRSDNNPVRERSHDLCGEKHLQTSQVVVLSAPATPAMITVPEAENFSPNSTSTRSGRAAAPACSIICAVDLATSMIASYARRNASSTLPAARAARPEVASVPATGTASTSISISPTLTGISLPAATTSNPQRLPGTAAPPAGHLMSSMTIVPPIPPRHRLAAPTRRQTPGPRDPGTPGRRDAARAGPTPPRAVPRSRGG